MKNKALKFLLYFVSVYALFGFVILPYILNSQLKSIVKEQTNATLECQSISFNPFLLKLSLHDLALFNLKQEKLIEFKKFEVDFEAYSLLSGATHFQKIALIEPKIYIEYYKDKTLNLQHILKPSTQPQQEKTQKEENTPLQHFIVDRFILDGGYIGYKDFTRQQEFTFSLKRIGCKIEDIDTQKIDTNGAKLRFYTLLGDGGFLELRTSIENFSPFIAHGDISFEASKLYTEWKYLQENLNLEVADGHISFHTNYTLNLEDLNATKIEDLNIVFEKLRIKPKNGFQDVLNINKAYINNAQIFPFSQKVQIEKVGIDGLALDVKRNTDAKIDWMQYIQTNFPQMQPSQKKQTQEPTKPWDLKIKEVTLENIGATFQDNHIKPHVTTTLNTLNLYAQDITLEGSKPFHYEMNLKLNDTFLCQSTGEITHKNLQVRSSTLCNGFEITHYNPYIDDIAKKSLQKYDIDLQKAMFGFKVDLQLHKENNTTIAIDLNNTNLILSDLLIAKKSTHEKLIELKSIDLLGLNYTSLNNTVQLNEFAIHNLHLLPKRYKNNLLNISDLIVAKKSTEKQTKQTNETSTQPLRAQLKHFHLDDAKVSFQDQKLPKSTTTTLDKIQLNAYNIDIAKKTWLNYALSLRINKQGYIKSKGKIQHTPLKQKGDLNIEHISLKEITPYLQEKAFVSIDDGSFSLKAKTLYNVSQTKPDLQLNGSFLLQQLYVVDSRDKSSLVSLSDLALNKITFELFPNRLYVDEVDVGSFYLDVLVDKNKKLNFVKLLKDTNATKQNTQTATEIKKDNSKEKPFPLKIAKVKIKEGNMKFADLSIPIEFRTLIHNLHGDIYSISNMPGETTYVDLVGDVDKYGSTKLKGSLNGSNPKEFTDLDFYFKNLELNALSGYSASFAGYEIDSGKLYLDLGYKINNSELLGENSIIIKNITLGKEIEDENVTKLPLGFVIALLEDSNGVIDIDMPVEGNVDDPDFKYGALVFKTLGNLIAKAVLSPFQFLGSMMGIDGEELEYAEFEAGKSDILPTEREKLDNIAKMMLKRPKISLSLAPTYDTTLDKKALQLEKLISLVVQKSGISNRDEHINAMTIDMLEDIYDDIKDDDKVQKLKEKLQKEYTQNEDAFHRAYLNALLKLTISIQNVNENELALLAKTRVQKIQTYLHLTKQVPQERLLIKALQTTNESDTKQVKMKLEIEVK